MTTLKAEKRDMSVKAKALRRQGKVTGNLYGREMEEDIAIDMTALDAKRVLKTNGKGSQLMLDLDGKQVLVLVKDMEYEPLKHQYTNVDLQALVEGETVTSTAPIILHNADKVQGYLTHALSEVTYKATPSSLVDKVEIDVGEMKVGTVFYVKDLDLAKDKNVEMITPADSVILHIAEHQKGVMDEEETAEEPVAVTEA